MKIKIKKISFEQLQKIKLKKYHRPIRPLFILRFLVNLLSKKELKDINFSYTKTDMEKLKKFEPCLILMNHSAFVDLKIFFKYGLLFLLILYVLMMGLLENIG